MEDTKKAGVILTLGNHCLLMTKNSNVTTVYQHCPQQGHGVRDM